MFERKPQLPNIEPRIPTITEISGAPDTFPKVESYQFVLLRRILESRPPGHYLFVFVLFLFIKNVFSLLSSSYLLFPAYKYKFQVILGYSSVFFRYLSQLMLICLHFGSLKALISSVITKEKNLA